MSLANFISVIIKFLGKCFSNLEDFIYFLIDFPGLIGGVVSTFPSFVIAGFTTIAVFISIAFIVKLYNNLH